VGGGRTPNRVVESEVLWESRRVVQSRPNPPSPFPKPCSLESSNPPSLLGPSLPHLRGLPSLLPPRRRSSRARSCQRPMVDSFSSISTLIVSSIECYILPEAKLTYFDLYLVGCRPCKSQSSLRRSSKEENELKLTESSFLLR